MEVRSLLSQIYRGGATPVVVSHHNQNESNYMLYEMVYHRVPVVHTSPSLKPCGLYYDVTRADFESGLRGRFERWRGKGFVAAQTLRSRVLSKVSTRSARVGREYMSAFVHEGP